MSALQKLIKLEQEARDFGFDWPEAETIIEHAISECEEIKKAINQSEGKQRIQEEIGDLLHSAISLGCFLNFDMEQTLENITEKFNTRLQALKEIAKQRGFASLQGQPIDLLLELWNEAKSANTK